MAPAASDVLKKSAFRCLGAARYVVAAAVTVLMVAVIMYAVKVVHRPDDLTLWIVGGSVSVQRSHNLTRPFNYSVGGDNLTFTYTVRAVNPSSRVRIYYTDLIVYLRGRNSSSEMHSFLALIFPNMTVEHQSRADTSVLVRTNVRVPSQGFYFQALANGGSIADVSLKLNGTRVVQNIFTEHNMTSEQAVYYCTPITFGGGKYEDGDAGVDVPCTEDAPTTILDDPLPVSQLN
ncbi:hypothetical protein CFC21_075247 [Triticum aestivum]|uniref:Uncharacterized protein n=3 Tax=Triticum TaxID=4564 RepID=A0A9R0XQM6_TRITD|nr:hypothetical protein CFC21_075247 [Triticum aestivum]VAI40745.1 unnamed protein product [Triticum turgidum subsp. durum]